MRRRRLVGCALVGVVLARGAPVAGGALTDFTQREFWTLPRLCLAQQFINQELDAPVVPEAERNEVLEQQGKSFIHYHHFCWALLLERRAERPGGDKYDYTRAVDNLNYVIRNADRSFALLPGVYLEKGNVLLRIAQPEAAAAEYQNALRLKADFTPASVALIQTYLDLGDLTAAREVLEQALPHDPTSAALAAKKSAVAAREK